MQLHKLSPADFCDQFCWDWREAIVDLCPQLVWGEVRGDSHFARLPVRPPSRAEAAGVLPCELGDSPSGSVASRPPVGLVVSISLRSLGMPPPSRPARGMHELPLWHPVPE